MHMRMHIRMHMRMHLRKHMHPQEAFDHFRACIEEAKFPDGSRFSWQRIAGPRGTHAPNKESVQIVRLRRQASAST